MTFYAVHRGADGTVRSGLTLPGGVPALTLRWARPFTVELERLVTLPRELLRTSAAAQAQAQAQGSPRLHPHARPLQTAGDERDD
jgi:hypothetical protein